MTLRICSTICLLACLAAANRCGAEELPIDDGHVVVQGDYLQRPYRVTVEDEEVLINAVLVARLDGRGTETSLDELVANIERCLFRGWTLIAFDAHSRLVLDSVDTSTFWKSLLDADSPEQRVQLVFEEAEFDPFHARSIPTLQWRRAMQGFEPSSSLREYVEDCSSWDCAVEGEADHDQQDSDALKNEEPDPASDASFVLYGLNTVGMLLAVVSFGVLINNRPLGNMSWSSIVESADTYGLTTKCLSLSVVLSIFDLVSTTIAASSADFGFIELNPLAAKVIGDPSILTAVKLLGTGLSAGLLWSQRRYVGAQQAAWWICFVLTLVTARWVVVDSLFVC